MKHSNNSNGPPYFSGGIADETRPQSLNKEPPVDIGIAEFQMVFWFFGGVVSIVTGNWLVGIGCALGTSMWTIIVLAEKAYQRDQYQHYRRRWEESLRKDL